MVYYKLDNLLYYTQKNESLKQFIINLWKTIKENKENEDIFSKIIVYTQDANEIYFSNGDIFKYTKSNSNLMILLLHLSYYLK